MGTPPRGVIWVIGLGLALVSAVATNIGFLLRHRGARSAPTVDVRRPARTVAGLFRQRAWTIGYLVAVLAWLLHVGALEFAPLSQVQAVLASGFVVLGVAAERWFGFEVGRRQWIGIGLAAAGLAGLALTTPMSENGKQADYGFVQALSFESGLAAGAALLVVLGARRQSGVLLGAAAGLLFSVSHVGIKALTGMLSPTDPASLLTPWVPVVVAAFVVAFFASARSLQIGEAVAVIAVTSLAGNLSAIAAGIVVFGDPIGANAAMVALRMSAFLLVVAAAALLPAPVRAAGMTEEEPAGAPATRRPVPAHR